MLKSVLKPKSSKGTKKKKATVTTAEDAITEETKENEEEVKGIEVKKKTAVKRFKKKGEVKIRPTYTMTRFFTDYGDSPHLQAIEDSYLKFLNAQYAKESHLKAVKKFQIMFALKRI